ncbi:MAG: helix-turn-helix transcriptional regulator [Tatlockia sp.]|nr:helix-turn-helix transcriptional regulator [Tatlockia sp.]
MSNNGLVRLKIKEFAAKEGWTLKQVADKSGIAYGTIKTYAVSPGMAMADINALRKLAKTFDILIEDLLEVVKE